MKERMHIIENILNIINSIDNVIAKRRARGASNEDINKYKLHLMDIWKDTTIRQFLRDY